MNIIMLFLAIFLLCMVSIAFAADKVPIDDIYGIWVNSDYDEKAFMAKEVDLPN